MNRVIILVVVLSLFSCRDKYKDCLFTKPEQIFPDSISTLSGNIEHVYHDLFELEITHSGCDDIAQEFRFSKRRGVGTISQLRANFYTMGNISPHTVQYTNYARAIDSTMIDKAVEVQEGYYFSIREQEEHILFTLQAKFNEPVANN